MNSIFRHIRQSLSLKLSLGIVLLAIPFFVVSLGILFQQSRHDIRQEATERVASVLDITTHRVSRNLLSIETATNANDWHLLENLQPDSLLAWTRRIVLMNGHVSGCSVSTEPYVFPQIGKYFSAYTVRKGDSIVTAQEDEYNYFERIWYHTPVQLGKACWVDPYKDEDEGSLTASQMLVSYCKPLFTDDGRLVGVIASDLSLKQLADVVQQEKPSPNSYFIMLGENGHFFIHPDSTLLIHHTIFSNKDISKDSELIALGHAMITGGQGTSRIQVRGESCLVCYQPVPGTSWSLAIVCPESDILRNYHHLTAIITPLIVIGLLLILLFCRRIVDHAIKPLNLLLKQAQRIEEGHYEEPIPLLHRQDAVGRLQNSFHVMQESLERHLSDIQQKNEQAAHHNEQLMQASQLAEKSAQQKVTFIQNMTHQIRTPLNIIMGFGQVLRDSIKLLPAEEVKDMTAIMYHNAHSLNRMLLMLYDSSDVGTTAELENLNCEDVPCNKMARESISTTQEHYEDAHFNFETSVDDSLCIWSNYLYALRTIRELLYNAAKYSDGKNIWVRVSETEKTVRFTVEDTGPGMPEENYELMYMPFNKSNDLSEGLGLGLPLTVRHIKNLGGTFLHDKDYHDGCRFIIEFPKKSS